MRAFSCVRLRVHDVHMYVCVCRISRTDVEGNGHYASLGNLANDSIEAGGMSSMWT